MTATHEIILILDFGSQYTQLIARRIREFNVYCEIIPYNADISAYSQYDIKGYILSGSPASPCDPDSPRLETSFYNNSVPVLAICYGMQLLAAQLDGELIPSEHREYGRSKFEIDNSNSLFKGVASGSQVWMSHGDSMKKMPSGFSHIGHTETLEVAAIVNEERKIYGLQFHPEVHHTTEGKQIIKNFLFDICNVHGDWTTASFIDSAIETIRNKVGDNEVILGISGGVDSTVAAVLLDKAIGNKLHAVFVNNGLLRKNEFEDVQKMIGQLGINIIAVDASEIFLKRLKGITDPEKKRKIIGNAFIDIFEDESEKLGDIQFLAQGTLYPDVIESVSFKGPSVTIKTHHNVGGLKDRMRLKLIEPLRELFKDEVRELGRTLGMSEQFIGRHPFPGPGLAVRILGEITKERCDLLREVDAIFIDQLLKHNIYNDIWQAFAVLLPVQSVGVMGDERTYENVVALRAVTSVDGMTADWARIDSEILAETSNLIIRNVRGVNRVTYDISSKPPATIEWE